MKGGIGLRRKISALIAINLISICSCVYKEKIVKNDLYRRTKRPYKVKKLQSTRIVKNSIKFQTNHSDITTYSHWLFFAVSLYLFHFSQTLPLKTIFFLEKVEIQQQHNIYNCTYTVDAQCYNTYIICCWSKKSELLNFSVF